MRKTLLCMALAALWPALTQAQTEPTVENLRAAIAENDVDGAGELLKSARDAGMEDLRRLYDVFETTSPRVRDFIRTWLDRAPDDPYAQAASAQLLYHNGAIVRGDKAAARTHPEALQAFNRMMGESLDMAVDAYDTDPGLIAASDMIIRLGNLTGEKQLAFDILAETMESQPNWGSLYLAVNLGHSGWGGRPDMIEWLCATYAPMLSSELDPVARCRIIGLFDNYRMEYRDELDAMLDAITLEQAHNDPQIAYRKARRMIITDLPTREGAEYGRWYFSTYPVTDVQLAANYDRRFPARFQVKPVLPEVMNRNRERAQAELENDPFNPALLDSVSRGPVTANDGGGHTIKAGPQNEQLDLAHRRLLAEPYSPEAWYAFQTAYTNFRRTYSPLSNYYLSDEPIWMNAIYYSRHDPQILSRYMNARHAALDHLKMVRREYQSQEGLDPRFDINEYDRLICPILRTWRVIQLVNTINGMGENDEFDPEVIHMLNGLKATAEADGECVLELTADPRELLFQPVDPSIALALN